MAGWLVPDVINGFLWPILTNPDYDYDLDRAESANIKSYLQCKFRLPPYHHQDKQTTVRHNLKKFHHSAARFIIDNKPSLNMNKISISKPSNSHAAASDYSLEAAVVPQVLRGPEEAAEGGERGQKRPGKPAGGRRTRSRTGVCCAPDCGSVVSFNCKGFSCAHFVCSVHMKMTNGHSVCGHCEKTRIVKLTCYMHDCEKRFLLQKTLNRHIKEAHNIQLEHYACTVCSDTFFTQRELADHQNRKRGGVITGCKHRKSDLISIATSSTDISLPSSLDIPEDGFDDNFIVSEDDLESMCRKIKKNNDSNNILSKPMEYFLGSGQANAQNIFSHPEFERMISEVEDEENLKKKQDKLFEDITVDNEQRRAVHKRLASGHLCDQNCTFLQRRLRLHRQQVLLGLEIVFSKSGDSMKWLRFIEGHLRRLKVHDDFPGEFLLFLERSCLPENADIVRWVVENVKDRNTAKFPPPPI